MKKPNHSAAAQRSVSLRAMTRVPVVILLLCAMAITAFAYYSFASTAVVENILAADYTLKITGQGNGDPDNGVYVCTDGETNSFALTASGTASTGYCTVTVGENVYTTAQIAPGETIVLSIRAEEGTAIRFDPSWGASESTDRVYGDGELIDPNPAPVNPFAGLTLSIMGDSISTYTGWSDADPINDESCTFRYGEAYYGPEGGDFHNTDMVVEDTWWHQAAQELEMEILRVNSGNSTGLLIASYPANADWDQYLKEMLAYKTRPNYMGKDGRDPDIIALYIGSNEVARAKVSQFGSIEDTDLEHLIVDNGDGTFTYAEPVTVADAYCILLHKLNVNYPDAEIYCFAAVPSAGGYLSTCNQRMPLACAFREMVMGVADYYGAHVVDLMEHFGLDPDGDGVAVEEDWDRFKTYFHNDPHPNAQGFDQITECFVKTVLENSKYAE